MTREQKIEWLRTATPQEFLAHYNSQLRRFTKSSLGDADWREVLEDWEITEAEMKKRLGA